MSARKNWTCLLLAAACTVLFPTWTADRTLAFSNSWFSVLIFAALFLFFRYCAGKTFGTRMKRYTYVLGLLFSVMTCWGYYLEVDGKVPYKSLPVLASVPLFAWAIALLLRVLWTWLEETETRLNAETQAGPAGRWDRAAAWLNGHPAAAAALLLVCWLPCYLATFPGGFHYDATSEMNQLANGFNGNFPLLHTVIVTRLLPAMYRLTGSYNTGIAVYTVTQMIVVSAMFTHILCKLYRQGVNKRLLTALFLYYALFPVVPMMATQMVRDILFSILLVYAVFLFYLMASETETFMRSRWKPFLLGLVFVLALLARNNNAGAVMYAAVFGVSALVWFLYRKTYLRGGTIFAVTSAGGYLILSMLLVRLCQPMVPADMGASLSLFSQPLARAFVTEPELWSFEERVTYIQYFNGDDGVYVAENADPTKGRLTVDGDLGEFLRFWLQIGMKHKKCYLDAILANTRQMWFPASVIDGYQEAGVGEYDPYDKCYYFFSDTIEKPGELIDLLPPANAFYTAIGLYLSFEKIPVVSMLFSIGFQFWILLNCVFYVRFRRCGHLYVPLAILLGYMLVSAFVPLVLLRYFAAVFLAMPLILCFTVQPVPARLPSRSPASRDAL